jgi:hypothetical protein
MRTLAPLAALAFAAGCTTPAYVSPVEVTRFTAPAAAQLGRGSIAVRAAPGGTPNAWEFAAFQAAVAQELAELGYTVSDGASQVAEIRIERVVAQGEGRRSPVNVGVGGSTGSYGSGMGVGVGIDLGSLGGGRRAERIDTQLHVMIRPSSGGDALWEGRARFTATSNSDYADQRAAAGKLADALFDGFPGRSGETIEVR